MLINNNSLLAASIKSPVQGVYLNHCDIINKYLIANISELPTCKSIIVLCDNNSFSASGEVVHDELLKFQVVLLYYFLILLLPSFYLKKNLKNNLVFHTTISDQLKIDTLLSFFFLEGLGSIKNRNKIIIYSESNTIFKLKLEVFVKNLILSKEIFSVFGDFSTFFSVEKVYLHINISLKNDFLKRVSGMSYEEVFKNLVYLWSLK